MTKAEEIFNIKSEYNKWLKELTVDEKELVLEMINEAFHQTHIVEQNEQLKFENRKKKIEAFKIELKALMTKYNFGKTEHDNYNGMDEYCGTDYYFTIDGTPWYSETIAEILDEVISLHQS